MILVLAAAGKNSRIVMESEVIFQLLSNPFLYLLYRDFDLPILSFILLFWCLFVAVLQLTLRTEIFTLSKLLGHSELKTADLCKDY